MGVIDVTKVSIVGDEAIRRKLTQLSAGGERVIIEPILKRYAARLVPIVKRYVPVGEREDRWGSYDYPGRLRASIGHRKFKKKRRGLYGYTVGPARQRGLGVPFYASMVELGSVNHLPPSQPLRKAFQLVGDEILNRAMNDITLKITDAWFRSLPSLPTAGGVQTL